MLFQNGWITLVKSDISVKILTSAEYFGIGTYCWKKQIKERKEGSPSSIQDGGFFMFNIGGKYTKKY